MLKKFIVLIRCDFYCQTGAKFQTAVEAKTLLPFSAALRSFGLKFK